MKRTMPSMAAEGFIGGSAYLQVHTRMSAYLEIGFITYIPTYLLLTYLTYLHTYIRAYVRTYVHSKDR